MKNWDDIITDIKKKVFIERKEYTVRMLKQIIW